jgi:hypothetical protein
MKIFLLLLLLVIPGYSQTSDRYGKIFAHAITKLGYENYNIEMDKFRKEIRVDTSATVKGSRGKMAPKMIVTAPENGETRFYLFFTGQVWNQPTLRILADDHLITVKSDSVDTSVLFHIPTPDLKRMTEAKTLEMQLLAFEGEFDRESRDKLRKMYGLFNF